MEWAPLESLEEGERRDLFAAARRRTWARDEVVCHAGDPSDSMHLIAGGRLSVRAALPSGHTAVIHVFGPGDHFGESALLGSGTRRVATVTALEPAETLVLTEPAYRQLCERRPALLRVATLLMSNRVDELSRRLFETLYLGLDHRVRSRLAELCGVYGGDGEGPVVVPLNQSQIADLTGGTRPSVNQVLQRLVDEGVVAMSRGRVEVLEPGRLTG